MASKGRKRRSSLSRSASHQRAQANMDPQSQDVSVHTSGLPDRQSSTSEVALREVNVQSPHNEATKFGDKISESITSTVERQPQVLGNNSTDDTDLVQGDSTAWGPITNDVDSVGEDAATAHPYTPGRSDKTMGDAKPPSPDASDAWAECAKQVWDREESMVRKWKDEISNLLTFAGLFSAALTAFNVQYYTYLQSPRLDTSTQVLVLISSQLGVLAANAGHTDVTQQMLSMLNASYSSTHIPAHTVSINTLWFSALVFSLSAASIAISVSQWLHHHLDRATTFSEQSVHVWFFRHRSSLKWRIPFIIGLLPVLLQASLTLFLVGLVELLWTLNDIVAGIVTGLVATLLTATMLTALLPAFFLDCPFKSSPAWWCFVFLQKLVSPLDFPPLRMIGPFKRWRDWLIVMTEISGWREFDEKTVQSTSRRIKDKLEMILEADAMILDDAFLRTVVWPCLQESSLDPAYHALRHTFQRRGYDNEKTERSMTTSRGFIVSPMEMGKFCADMLCKITSDAIPNDHVRATYHLLILEVMEKLGYLIPDFEPAKTIYCPLLRLWKQGNIAKPVRDKMASIMYKSGFTVDLDKDLSPQRPEMLAYADATLKDASILAKGVRSCLQRDDFVAALHTFYKILQHRGYVDEVGDVNDCLAQPRLMEWSPTGQDAQTVIAIGHISLDMFDRITRTPMTQHKARERTQANILTIVKNVLGDVMMPRTEPSVFHRLVRLLGTPDLSNPVAALLAEAVVYHSDAGFPVNVECVRMPFSSFPPLATHESDDPDSKRLLKLSGSAIRMARRLTQSEFNKVRGDIKDGLSAMAKYLSESVISRMDWYQLFRLLCECCTFPDPSLIPDEAVDALARCASPFSNPGTMEQTSYGIYEDEFSQIPKLMEELRQRVDQSHNNAVPCLTSHPGDDGPVGEAESEPLSS